MALIFIIYGTRHQTDKLYLNNFSFTHLILVLLLHYLVKIRSHSFVVYNNEFIPGSTYVDSESH